MVLIDSDFKDLPDSPWFFKDLYDFINEQESNTTEGRVYKFVGTYKKFKNGNYKFSGETKDVLND